jgi:drug/metabolite transporter (DMT)-like permease
MTDAPGLSPPRTAMPAVIQGALWMVLSCGVLTLLAALGRHLSSEMHPFQIVFFRVLFGFLAMLPWVAYRGIGVLRTTKLTLYLVRATSSFCAMTCWFYAISLIPIAEVTALSFLAPLFATLGAGLVLREIVGIRRWSATLIGFAGALIIIRPGMIEMATGNWLALGSAVFMGTSVLIIKMLTRTENANVVVFYMGLLMTPVALIPALFVWETPAPHMWIWIVLMGPVAAFGHVTMVRAFSTADASAIVPFDFSRLPFAVLIGYLAFGELADFWTWVGAAVIFISSVYIARREARLNPDKPVAAAEIT